MAAIVKYPGIVKLLGGVEYVIPPISLGSLQQLQDRITKFNDQVDAESISTVIDATHAALKRNYPEITIAEVAEFIDVGNMFEIFESVMDVSGMKRKAIEAEAAGSGEP